MATLLKGAAVAKTLTEKVKARADALCEKGVYPTLAIIRLGERDDDMAYERGAKKRCEQAGVAVRTHALPLDTPQDMLLSLIKNINADDTVHGVLIMRPLPAHISDEAVVNTLSPAKDVDGITPGSQAAVYSGYGEGFAPCTAQACIEILKGYDISLVGKKVAVVGRSLVIGKPVSMLLLANNATVTTCHTKTRDLAAVCRDSEIVIAAAGKAKVIGKEHFAEGQVVIDVGIHANEDGSLCGDVDTDSALDIVSAITPVPGGVGAVTTSVLIDHVVTAAEKITKENEK
ncbi:MAG: bifunctional 5,10-methylenetetrahydrofolate dehydrogenase/5,10-methenyltetrahydrofolate cyclohydrolase [Oscillospiraceae bacterium]|nr:bifunctional 5,10-methylenetetrahydrofolate dehydrogenase/5,10-methenyltetrahydrofolate cyclohydrolase [Oscillospiraceae bacterium]